jgi:hypothetical protein
MAIKHKITLVPAVGASLILIDDWAAAVLSEEELALFQASKQRHNDFVASKALSVDMDAGEMMFADEAKLAESQGVEPTYAGDPDFLQYWGRYLIDNGITVEISTETV